MGAQIRRKLIGPTLALSFTLAPSVALAATWAGGTTPAVTQLFAIDKTGEDNWLYGAEDVAGDGQDTACCFKQQEQSIDIRTAYAATDSSRFWCRVYMSDLSSPGGNVTVYVFIDKDKSASTGGTAAATAIDPKFTSDATSGGYDFVIGIQGNQTISGIWEWAGNAWTPKSFQQNQVAAEAGIDLDPIRLNGDVHGYLQGSVDLALVGLTAACDAELYVRTTNNTPQLGEGDLEVGDEGSCVPTDDNQNGVPDPIETNAACTTDAQCPNGGVCVNGRCVFSAACATEADCPSTDYVCTNGRCTLKPTGTTCTDNGDCTNGEVCISGTCGPCSSGGTCSEGQACGPDGRCIGKTGGAPCETNDDCSDGEVCINGGCGPYDLEHRNEADGEEFQGGACACSAPGSFGARAFGLVLVSLPLLLVARRWRRRSHRSARRFRS